MEKGLPVEINAKPGAAVIVYKMSKQKRKTIGEPHE